MRRMLFVGLFAVGLLAGCGPQAAPGPRPVAVVPDDDSNGPVKPVVNVLPDGAGPVAPPSGKTIDDILASIGEPTKQDRYNSSLMDALELLAQKKQTQALAALEAAKTAAKDADHADQDGDQIQREIDRLKETMSRQAGADVMVQNIRAVLDDGRAEEAAKLAAQALAQYGGSDAADDLLKLKREADALVGAQTDADGRKLKVRAEAQAALEAKNLRAAAVALEQALQQGDDDELKKQLDDVHDRLSRYDDNRRRAGDLRRDPATLDDAVAALQEAQKAWDTFEVQQQIAEYTLALQTRRDRLSVADLEVRGEVGLADAGRTLAEELLPAFKSRFDLLERGQLNRVVDELKLEASDLNGGQNQAEVGRLARLRYLVVGSVTRLGGVTINARLVDVRSGLVVQTGRVSAPTAEELLPLLPQLATMLMMTDEQKMAYSQQLAKQVADAPKPAPVEQLPLPPPPEVRPDDQPPPAPVVTATPFAPPVGDVKAEDFQNLPPPPPPDQAPVVVIEERVNDPVKLRLRHVCIELGDNLFRRGRFREAHVQFELALNAGCERRDVEIRIDRCRPFLPPPPPVEIVVVAPPPPPRPRIAILDLAVIGDPDVVPPSLGPWTADNLAPYFCANYDVVDRDTVCWYMNRLGLSLRDVLTDSIARRWLGRALGVRFFVLGDARQTASFVVTTHLVDAECGYEYGSGSVHVHNPFELKLRLGELAGETMLDPVERRRRQEEIAAAERERQRFAQLAEAERLRALQESQNVPLLVLEAQRSGDRGDIGISIELLGRARKLRPDNIEINVLFNGFNDRHRRNESENDRKRQWEAQQAALAAQQQQQLFLARAGEEARLRAAQEAAARQAVDAQALEQQRQQAFLQLQAQAQFAIQQQQFNQAIQLYQSALAIRQTDEVFRALAQARARADEADRLAAAQAAAQQEAVLRQQRENELAGARLQLLEQHRAQEAHELAERAAREARDQALYQRLLDDAQGQLAKDQYDSAISSLQTARQMRRTDEVERLLSQALVEQAKATAQKNNPGGAADLERQLAEEKVRREKAEAQAAHYRELYETSLKLAQKALDDKNYDVAQANYEEAGKVYKTDIVLAGLQRVKTARTEDAAAAAAEQAKKDAETKKDAEFKRLSGVGLAALEQKQYDRAVKLLNDANQIKPGDVGVLTALSKAEHERADAANRAKKDAEATQQEASFHQFLEGGKANLAAKQYDAAVSALKEAIRLKPADKEAIAALRQAEKAQADVVKTEEQLAQAQKKMEAYQKWMTDGRAALSASQFDVAINAFGEAQKLQPGDAASLDFQKKAQKAKSDAETLVAETKKKHEEEQQRAADVKKSLGQARAALVKHDLEAAGKAVAAAAEKAPNDAEVKKVQQDLQTALAAAKADADARKKRAEQIQTLVKKGADAQAAQRYDDAVQAFSEASQLAPDDAATKDLLTKALKARDDVKTAADKIAAQKAAAEQAMKVRYLVADARKALAAQDYEGAGKLLADARKLSPDDPAAAKVQDDLAKASKATTDKLKKQHDDYTLAMGAGKSAVGKGDYTGAVNAYTEALRIMPADKDAAAALQNAQQAKTTAEGEAKRKAEEAKRRDDYTKLMAQGQTAMTGKQYADAAKAFTDALKVQPEDVTATRALRDANQAAADAVRSDADRKKREAAYGDAMKAGREAMTAKKYDDALKSFTEAARQMPDDKAAATALKDVRSALDADAMSKQHETDYANAMKAGRAALAGKKYAEAVKAFTEAGKIMPGDKAAADALKDAAAGADGETKRREDFNKLLGQGQTAMKAGRYDDAAKAYSDALKMQPDDAVAATGLQNANAAMGTAKSDAEKKKREADYTDAMKAGRTALAAKQYGDAVKAFTEAGRILPGDKDAAAGLKDARAAMDVDAGAKKREADYADAMKAGRTALTAKKYADAVKAFTEAGKLFPGDKDAATALKAAQDAADADAKKKVEETKRQEDMNRLLTQGQTALLGKRYDEAAKAFNDVLKLDPTDQIAIKGLRDANAAMDSAKADADKKKRDADYAGAMAAGRAALTAKKYDDAVKAFTDAGKILPGDKAAADALKAAQDGAALDAKKKMEEAKKREDFNKLMAQGQAALTANHLDDAVKLFGDATKQDPTDPGAAKALRDATQAMQAAQAAKAGDAEKKKRDADYAAAMATGRDAVKAKRFDDAAKAFSDAAKIMPGDKDAAASLKDAQTAAAADAAKKAAADAAKKAEDAKRTTDFTTFMTQGQTAAAGKKYDDAIKAYTAALQLQPGDAKATSGLQGAQFNQHMAAGQALSAAKKYADAAKEFDAALAIFPDSPDAKAALKRAKSNMP